jgi:hypothetical protein
MVTPQEKFDSVLSSVSAYAPSFKTILKSDSKFHRAVGWLFSLLGNKAYMSDFWTTIGQTVARPTICGKEPLPEEWKILCHEGRHAADAAEYGTLPFFLFYLFPQVLGILGILYGLALVPMLLLGAPLACLWGLLALACLAPLPALGRAILEFRGYTVTMAVDFWNSKISDEVAYIDWIAENFVGGSYYYMFPFKGYVNKYFVNKLGQLKDGSLRLDGYLAMCRTKSILFRS